MATQWDPDQYLRFATARERPFWDLVAAIPHGEPAAVVDLGCGPGTATAGLVERWPGAAITGIDRSEAMISRATDLPEARAGLVRFEVGDLREWEPEAESVDVILSNATLQWVPGHLALISRWWAGLATGGVLAFQVPANFDAPSHVLMRQVADTPEWAERLAWREERPAIASLEEYYEALAGLGATVDAWDTTYLHVLTGADPVLEWLKGTGLRPYLQALDRGGAEDFQEMLRPLLRAAYPEQPSGGTLLPFRRRFVVATKT